MIAPGGAGVVIASQSGHRLGAVTAEENAALATTPADELLTLPMLQLDRVKDSLHAYQLNKRGNSLRVMAEAVRWGKRGARINTISSGIIVTPLAKDELTGPRGEGYRRMIELCPVGRAGTPDEVGAVGALLMGADGAFITGSDFLMDGGVTASYWYGELLRSDPHGEKQRSAHRGISAVHHRRRAVGGGLRDTRERYLADARGPRHPRGGRGSRASKRSQHSVSGHRSRLVVHATISTTTERPEHRRHRVAKAPPVEVRRALHPLEH